MTVYAITDTKKGRTGIAPTYLQVGAGAAFSNTVQIMIIIGAVSRTAFTLHSIVEGLRLASCEMLFLLLLVTCMRTDFHHFSSS